MDEKLERKKRRPQKNSSLKSTKRTRKKTDDCRPRKQASNSISRKVDQPQKRKPRKKVQKKEQSRFQKNSSVLAVLFNLLFYAFILAMISGSLLFATSKNTDKTIFGYRFFGVLTDSMVPRDPKTQKGGFHSGDVIVIKNIAGDSAEVEDIITFRPNMKSQAFLTHRVKKKLDHLGDTEGIYYITQGDANLAEDVPVNEKQVVGKKVFVVPKVGRVLNFVSENLIVSVVFMISILGFITIIRYYILNK